MRWAAIRRSPTRSRPAPVSRSGQSRPTFGFGKTVREYAPILPKIPHCSASLLGERLYAKEYYYVRCAAKPHDWPMQPCWSRQCRAIHTCEHPCAGTTLGQRAWFQRRGTTPEVAPRIITLLTPACLRWMQRKVDTVVQATLWRLTVGHSDVLVSRDKRETHCMRRRGYGAPHSSATLEYIAT